MFPLWKRKLAQYIFMTGKWIFSKHLQKGKSLEKKQLECQNSVLYKVPCKNKNKKNKEKEREKTARPKMIYCFSSVFSLVSFFSAALLSSFTESSSNFAATFSALLSLSVPAKRLFEEPLKYKQR